MNYTPITENNREEMLKRIGVRSINDLLMDLKPPLSEKLALSEPMSELELSEYMRNISQKNKILKYFIGAGSYNHYIPSAVNHLLMRGEFLTGYTPYQAEMNQGTLHTMYEFQSYICLLTGMDVANASMYEGSSALAEAVLLSSSYNGRNCIFVKNGLNPQYLEVLKTYCEGADLRIVNEIDESTACVIAQNPDFYGNVENLQYISEQAHKVGALFITCVVEPTSLAILEPPGNYGADIVVGEGQSFGIPVNFGGPYLGFMGVKSFLLKKIPGRICGMTTDSKGNKGFVLTFQAREQHIRRERATSNITTNVALMAIASTIYLALMGRNGLINVAKLSYSRAHLLHNKLKNMGFEPLNKKPFYNEFIMKAPAGSLENISSNLLKNGILGGLNLAEDKILICCTEMNTVQDIESYVSIIKETTTT
ncbi:MAG: aminomethyl-transferring glycine dehydrogenase subunit GcvPA [Thermoproteota archaeon]|jgi:glycine dehydrogenase subunit 1|nr:aminomethyl-transferring glycine dehydrogenase subunit GcvPA [Thermoproteota archaeon]